MDHSLLRASTVYYAVPPCELTANFDPAAIKQQKAATRFPTPPLSRGQQLPHLPRAMAPMTPTTVTTPMTPTDSAAAASIETADPYLVLLQSYQYGRRQLHLEDEPVELFQARQILEQYLGLDSPTGKSRKRSPEDPLNPADGMDEEYEMPPLLSDPINRRRIMIANLTAEIEALEATTKF